jgi:hypothetical protein
MKKSVVNRQKSYMSRCGPGGAPAAGCGRHGSPRVPGEAAAGAGWPSRPAARPAFAALRPGFFAACMVESPVAEAGGRLATAGAGTVQSAGREGRARVGGCPAGAAGEPARGRRRQGGAGSRPTGLGHPGRGQQNGQIEHFSRVAARLRKGVRRGAAITPREHADVRDLVLTTLSSEPCVQSSIFGFVMT